MEEMPVKEAPTIYIVDDDQLFCDVLKRSIQKHYSNVMVETYHNGLSFLSEFPSDTGVTGSNLVFLDVDMPFMTGFEVLEQVRSSYPVKAIPIVMITQFFQPESARKAYRQGVNMFIAKPENYKEVDKLAQSLTRFWIDMCELP